MMFKDDRVIDQMLSSGRVPPPSQVERGDPQAGAVGAAEGAERGGRVHGCGGSFCEGRAHGRGLPAATGISTSH